MKQLLLTLATLALVLMLLTSPASAEGNWDTDISTTIPQLTVGSEATVQTTVTSTVLNPPYLGDVHYYALDDTVSLIGQDTGYTVSSILPEIEFTLSSDMSVQAIQIPISSITGIENMGSLLGYNISTGSTLVVEGMLHHAILKKMVANGYLLLVFNSVQTSTPSISLTAGTTYTFQFTMGLAGMTFSFPVTDTTTEFYDGDVATGNAVPMVLHQGNKIDAIPLQNGEADLTFTPTQTFEQMLAYYSAPTDYESSFSLQFVSFTSSTTYDLTFDNVTTSTGQSVQLQAQLEQSGVGMPNKVIKFQIQESTSYTTLGQATTDGSGVASVSVTIPYDPGTYSLRVVAELTSSSPVATSRLVVNRPVAATAGIAAVGYYGGSSGPTTQITVSGYVQSQQGVGIESMALDLIQAGVLQGQATTDSNGYFEITLPEDLTVGVYSDYYTLEGTHSLYDFTKMNLDLVVNRGVPQISLNTSEYSLSYEDPFILDGNVTDQSGDSLSLEMQVQIYNTTWQTIHTFTTTGTFSETLPSDYTGQWSYRIKNTPTTEYSTGSTQFSATIDPVAISLITDRSRYDISYRGYIDITVSLDTTVSAEADITISVQDPVDLIGYVEVYSGRTSEKTLTFTYTPDLLYAENPWFYYSMIIEADSDAYDPASKMVEFSIVANEIQPSLNITNYTVLENSQLVFNVDDLFGNHVEDGIELTMTEGTTILTRTVSNGLVSFDHNFAIPGTIIVTLTHSSSIDFPYQSMTQDFTLQVAKGTLQLSVSDMTANQGEIITFTGQLTDHTGQIIDETITVYHQDGIWVELGTSTTQAGQFSFDLNLDQSYGRGIHNFRFGIAESVTYKQYSVEISVDIEKTLTQLDIIAPTSITYNSEVQDRQIAVDLSTVFGVSLDNRDILVEYNGITQTYATDSIGTLTYTIPNLLTPGTYQFTFTYAGETNYVETTQTVEITVTGTPTLFEWTTQPQNTYYGEYMPIDLAVKDTTGTYLEGMTVKVFIDGAQIASGTTDATGAIDFNLQLLFSSENLDVTVEILTKDGWEGTSQTFSIIQHKRVLDATITTQDGTGTVPFEDNLNISIYTFSDTDPLLIGVTASIYLYDPATESIVFIARYDSNSTGYIWRELDLPTHSTSDDYQIQVELTYQYYSTQTVSKTMDIVPTTIDVTSNFGPSTYLTSTDLTLAFAGDWTDGMVVDLSIQDSVHDFQSSQVVNGGQITTPFIPQKAGTITVGYTITDPAGNYQSLTGNFVLQVDKATPTIEIQRLDIGGVFYINVTLEVNGELSNGTIHFESGSTSFDRDIINYELIAVSAYNDATITVIEDLNLQATSKYVDLRQEEMVFVLDTPQAYAMIDNTINFTMDVPYSLDGHQATLYLVTSSGDIQLDSALSENSEISFFVPNQMSTGTYTVRIVYDTQSFFAAYSDTFTLEVVKQGITLTTEYDQFITGKQVNITLTAEVPREIPTGLELVILIDGSEVYRATLTDTMDISFVVTVQIGEHSLIYQLAATPQTSAFSQQDAIKVLQETDLVVVLEQTYQYGDDNTVFIRLLDPKTGSAIAGQTITLYECGIFCSTNSKQLGSATTNSSGYATFVLPAEYVPNTYDLFASFDYAGDTLAATQEEFSIQVQPETVAIGMDIEDYGITHNITIILSIKDEQGVVNTKGMIELSLDLGTEVRSYQYVYSGEPIITVYYEMVGQYTVSASFTPDSTYFQSASDQTTMGWTKLNSVGFDGSTTLGSLEHFTHLFTTSDDGTLHNITVELYVDNELYGSMILDHGQLPYPLQLAPGSYIFEWRISNSLYLTTDWIQTQAVEVTKGQVDFVVTSAPTPYGNDLVITINDTLEDPINVTTYLIQLHTPDELLEYNTTAKVFTVPDHLDIGTYSLTVTRQHIWLEPTVIDSELEVKPVAATLTIAPTPTSLEFFITPLVDDDRIMFTVTFINDTHRINMTVTSLSITHNMAPGTYRVSYILQGIHSGSAELTIIIPPDGNSDDMSDERGPTPLSVHTLRIMGGGMLMVLAMISKRYISFRD